MKPTELLINVCGPLGRRRPKPPPLSPADLAFYESLRQRQDNPLYWYGLAASNSHLINPPLRLGGSLVPYCGLGGSGGLCSLLGI